MFLNLKLLTLPAVKFSGTRLLNLSGTGILSILYMIGESNEN